MHRQLLVEIGLDSPNSSPTNMGHTSAGEVNGSPKESLGGDAVRIVHSPRNQSPTVTPTQPQLGDYLIFWGNLL